MTCLAYGLCKSCVALGVTFVAGIFGAKSLGGIGGVSLLLQLLGTSLGIVIALAGGTLIYGVLKQLFGLRISAEEEYDGSDLIIHKISATAND